MRPVTVFEYYRPDGASYSAPLKKREQCKGMFHQFGFDYEEFESGPGNYTTAIVELEDGTVITPVAEMIRFDDKHDKGSREQ